MQIVGEKVIHKAFGKGIVIDYKEDHISVYFSKTTDEKKFVYPDAFEKFLAFESSNFRIGHLQYSLRRTKRDRKSA